MSKRKMSFTDELFITTAGTVCIAILVGSMSLSKCTHDSIEKEKAIAAEREAVRNALHTDTSPITLVSKEKIQQARYYQGSSDVGFLHYNADKNPDTIEFTARIDFGNVTETARFHEEKVGEPTKVSVASKRYYNFQNVRG